MNGGAAASCLSISEVPSSARVEGFTFTNGNATDGGGIHCSSASSSTIAGNTISGNEAPQGAGIACSSSPSSSITNITNNTISGNAATATGGGISCHDSSPAITNTIVAFSGGRGGIYVASGSPTISYCDVFGNTGGNNVNFTPTEAGNISQDPLFADAANGDFHLKSTSGRWNGTRWVRHSVQSPCIDTGAPGSDYSGEAPPNGGRVNMGCRGSTSQASMTGTGLPSVASVAISPDPAYTGGDLITVPSGWSDPDGDPEDYDYQWAKHDGGGWVDIPAGDGRVLAASNFVRGDLLRVTC